ncbi:Ig-like domain-containing protein [Sulfitobacter sp.]|uniref:Ig-like domain-containing protein n=1 Tax=Sulfitobacter sp. TaxID=1903071 RepID=UPI003001CA3F
MIRIIDFNNLTAGEAVTNQYSDLGVRIVTAATPPGANQAMIFDSNNPTGGDEDLATDNLDNVLIISEDGDATDPDDNTTGGAFNFQFDNPVAIKSLTFLDLEAPARMLFFGADGSLISEQFVPPTGDNGQTVVQLFVPGTVRFEVVLQETGAIDNLVFEDDTVDPDGDGIVSGDDSDNLIDLAYTGDPEGDRIDAGDALIAGEAPNDDIVDALGGNDTITAFEGDDDIYAGAGDDFVSGGEGDDLIFGDRTLAHGTGTASGARKSFNWSDAGVAEGETLTTFTQDTGSVNVTFTTLSATPKTTISFSTETQRTDGIDGESETVATNSSLSSETRLDGQGEVYELGFDTPVTNVDFNINDIDGDSLVRVLAFDADGNPLEVTLVGGGGLTLSDSDGVPGADTASSDGGYTSADNPFYSLQVDIAGPVSRIEIQHDQTGSGNTSVNITDVFFTAGDGVVVDDFGNDDLSGDAGDDTIFGEGGDDTLTGGTGADSLSGGDDADLFIGGNAGDVVDGGTGGDDRDTLDLTGSGPLRVVDETVDADGDSTSGTVEFLNDGGTVSGSMTFAEIETLIVDPIAPVAVDDVATTEEDTAVIVDLRGNDTDPDNTLDELTLSDIAVPAEQGSVVDNGDGTVTFTPAPDFNGDATITYTITDPDGQSDEGQVVVTVTPFNDAPVASDDYDTNKEETPVTISILDNDTDPEDDPLTITEALSDDGTVVIDDDGTITFTPNEDFFGEAVIDYTITDGNGGFDDSRVFVTVNNINDDPVAVDDCVATPVDTPVTIPVLENDSDPDGDTLNVTAATSPDGDVAINDDGTITFTPNAGFTGDAEIAYTIEDGMGGTDDAVAKVSVGEDSGAPVAMDDAAETDEDTSVTIPVLANDTDPDGDTLEVVEATSPDGTVTINDDGTLEFTPNPDFNGEATITYTITDGNGGDDTAEVVVTVNPVNDGPLAEDDTAETDIGTPVTVPVLDNDSDIEGDPLTVISASSPDGSVVINDDGTLTFTPNEGFTGEAAVKYTISDGELTDPAVLFVTVTDPAENPVAVDDVAETPEDTAVTIPVLANDTDPNLDPLTVTEATSPDGEVVINDDGTITFTPDDNFNGPTTITYTVTDPDGNTDTATVDVTVTPVNDAPVAVDDTAGTNQDTPLIIDVLANDSDPDGDPLEVIAATSPNGTVDINDDGTITFTLAPGFSGPAEITYTVSDGNGGEAPGTVDVMVSDGIVTGTDGDDVIDTDYTGDPEGDLVDNNDGFLPGEGPQDDIINAGDGNDTVLAGEGDDDVSGGNGNDSIDGGVGDDELDGDAGDDSLIGGEGDDTLNGGAGDDVLDGDAGDDSLSGDDGNDTLNGGADDDVLDGGVGDDSLNGDAGNDTIDGDDGNDTVDGGTGNDVIDTSGGSPLPDIGYPGVFPADPDPEDDRDSVVGGDGNDTITTGDDSDTIQGGAGDDFINAGIDDDDVDGGEGDDRIVGSEGNDTILGGGGNDTIYANNDPDFGLDAFEIEDDGSNPFGPDLAPDNGDDFVDGGAGDDVIFGGDDNDTLLGGSGNDFLDGGIDDDLLRGGTGDNTLIGGQGNDSIDGGQGADSLDGGIGNDTLRGNRDDDTLQGGEGDDSLDGGGQNDSLSSDAGDDMLMGGSGDDTLDGGDGNDSLDGGQGNDDLNGDAGDDTLDGALGDDTLRGGDGDDVLTGGSGDDILLGNAGNDTMTGGNDCDIFRDVNAGDVVDGSEGGDDFDCLELAGSAPEGGRLEIVYADENPENGVVNYFNEDGSDAGQLVFTNIEKVVPCFTPGTMIATPKGERKVEELVVGDRIITRDNGMQVIRWIGRREMSGEELVAKEHLRPILIRQGALGNGLPERDMMVSPQHRVLIANDKTALYFEEREVLVAAKRLTDIEGIDMVDVSHTSYIHIMFDQHEVILSDGIWTESFQPGDLSLAGVGDASREEILEFFPEFATRKGIEAYAAARKSLKKHEAKLVTKNN